MRIQFLLDHLYLGKVGGSPTQRGRCMVMPLQPNTKLRIVFFPKSHEVGWGEVCGLTYKLQCQNVRSLDAIGNRLTWSWQLQRITTTVILNMARSYTWNILTNHYPWDTQHCDTKPHIPLETSPQCPPSMVTKYPCLFGVCSKLHKIPPNVVHWALQPLASMPLQNELERIKWEMSTCSKEQFLSNV